MAYCPFLEQGIFVFVFVLLPRAIPTLLKHGTVSEPQCPHHEHHAYESRCKYPSVVLQQEPWLEGHEPC